MKVVDVNVLLYSVNSALIHHESARDWLARALGGSDTVGFTWMSLTGFIRISTKVGVFPLPLTTGEAIEQARNWLSSPGARVLEPTAEHLEVLDHLLGTVGSGGNLVPDAHLAAAALEHRATVVTYDSDFGRFPGVTWASPDALL